MLVLLAGARKTVPAAENARHRDHFQPGSLGEAVKETFAEPHPGMYSRRPPAAREGCAACMALWE